MVQTPGACPPGRYDVDASCDCVTRLRTLYDAYVVAVSGQQRIVVRFNDRWSEYARANSDALLTLYQTLYAQCPDAASAGLPDLNPNKKVARGRPARGFYTW